VARDLMQFHGHTHGIVMGGANRSATAEHVPRGVASWTPSPPLLPPLFTVSSSHPPSTHPSAVVCPEAEGEYCVRLYVACVTGLFIRAHPSGCTSRLVEQLTGHLVFDQSRSHWCVCPAPPHHLPTPSLQDATRRPSSSRVSACSCPRRAASSITFRSPHVSALLSTFFSRSARAHPRRSSPRYGLSVCLVRTGR